MIEFNPIQGSSSSPFSLRRGRFFSHFAITMICFWSCLSTIGFASQEPVVSKTTSDKDSVPLPNMI